MQALGEHYMADPEDSRVQIVIVVNGPGEISGWLYPLGTALKRRLPNAQLCVAIVPCTFSSGVERDVISSMSFVDEAWDVRETTAILLRNRLPKGFAKSGKGVLLHLGGEPALSALLALRLQLPCVAYTEHRFLVSPFFKAIYYSGLVAMGNGRHAVPAQTVGELMVDAAKLRCPDRGPSRNGRLTVGLYPGSRVYVARYMLPFYAQIANLVSEVIPDVDWALAKADYLPTEFLRNIPDIDDGRQVEADRLTYDDSGAEPVLVTTRGVRIAIRSPAEVHAKANLALTLPGSATAELAALGIPMIVTLPRYLSEVLALPGLAGHVARTPLVGKFIRRVCAQRYLHSLPFTAHPNRRSGRAVVPEIVGKISARQVMDQAVSILTGDRRAIEDDLRLAMGPPGAADRLIDGLLPHLKGQAQPA